MLFSRQIHIRPPCFNDEATLIDRRMGSKYLGVGAGGEGLHEGASDNGEVVDEAALEGGEILLDEVGGAVVRGEAAGEAVVVEVVVLAQVGVARHAVKGARHVGGDAQAVLVDQAVLLAWYACSKPAQPDVLPSVAAMRCWAHCMKHSPLLLGTDLGLGMTRSMQWQTLRHAATKGVCSPHDKAVEAEDGEEAGDEVDQPDWGLQAELDDVDVIPGGPLLRQGGCIGKLL